MSLVLQTVPFRGLPGGRASWRGRSPGLRAVPVPAANGWLFGVTIGATALAAAGLACLAAYCAWMNMPIPATHAAAASAIVCRRVRGLLQR